MAGRKSPGIAPLGHSPFGKEKLEGPKKHHDNHGKDASVPAKGEKRAIPAEHWEKQYNPDPAGGNTPAGAFLPKQGKNRPTPHSKINEVDH